MTVPVHPATRIGHVHLRVSDLGRAIGFYSGVLGSEVMKTYFGARAGVQEAQKPDPTL